jgi:hypothetical protein
MIKFVAKSIFDGNIVFGAYTSRQFGRYHPPCSSHIKRGRLDIGRGYTYEWHPFEAF